MPDNNPLISIIVITYNSSRFVLETLNSCYRQSYPNLELIISDDHSNDNTISICQDWVSMYSKRFYRTIITQTEKNCGICHNYNHALRMAKGEYIKYIAGDDILQDNCLEIFLHYVKHNIYIYFSGAERIFTNGATCCYIYEAVPNESSHNQLKIMLRQHPLIFGPTLFINRSKLCELGGFDERFPMSEDYPILMKFLTNGYACYFIEEPLVKWRMHENSVSYTDYNNFKVSVKKSLLYYSRKYSWRMGLFLTPYHDWLDFWIPEHHNKGLIYKLLGYILRCFDLVFIKYKLLGWPKQCIETV